MLSKTKKAGIPSNSPPTAYEAARGDYFDRNGSPIVEKSRYFVIATVMGIAIIAQSLGFATLIPLKTVTPYVIEKHDNGSVTASNMLAQKYAPGENEIRYFVVKWVTNMLEIDRFVVQQNLTDAYLRTRGKASQEFTDFLQLDKPIARVTEDVSLTRKISISSLSFIQEGAILVRYSLEERSLGSPAAKVTKQVMTIHYSINPPKTEEDIYQNPIGLFITHFAIDKDLEK